MLCAGGGIGTVVAFGLYVTKILYVSLLPVGVLLVLGSVLVKNYRMYWFTLFLLSLQFTFAKNLNDGHDVIERLKIDYTIVDFTFQITASDIVFVILLAIWANDRLFHGRPWRFPPVSWLALGYLGLCLISLAGAASPYLGFVEFSQQIKYFLVYLFAVNCLDRKSALRVLMITGVIILVTQGTMTVVRFETGYMTPLTFGDTGQDMAQIEEYLSVDRSDEGGLLRAFGTLGSPNATARVCMMVIPFALFLCARNTVFGMRLLFIALTAFSLGGLVLTFTRVFYITTAFQMALAFLIMIKDRLLKREEIILIVLIGLAGLAAASPKIYEQFTVREDSSSVRLLQYEATARMILDYPLFGVGLNNATAKKPDYANVTYDPFDPETQFYLEPTHNVYLSVASEIGIPGALLFFAFFARAAFLAWRQSRHSFDPEIRLAANAFVVVFCGVAVNSLMDPLPEYQAVVWLWLYAGMCLNLPVMALAPDEGAFRSRRRFYGRIPALAAPAAGRAGL